MRVGYGVRKWWARTTPLPRHAEPGAFALSAWQRGRSPLPLLLWRALTSLAMAALLAYSLARFRPFGKWFIYMTHWGLLLLGLTEWCALAVAVSHYLKGAPAARSKGRLPALETLYWLLYNMCVPIAFTITVFYWVLLYNNESLEEYAPNPFMDVAVHGLNSVLALVALCAARQPSPLLHVWQPLLFGVAWTLMSVVFWASGGTDPNGNVWIYPMVDWSQPGSTLGVVALTALLIVAMHGLAVLIAGARDALAARLLPAPSLSAAAAETPHARQSPDVA